MQCWTQLEPTHASNATKFAARAGRRSYCPSAQRYSMPTSRCSTKPRSLRPWRNALTISPNWSGDTELKKPITGIDRCCACAARGQATPAPASKPRNLRRRMVAPPSAQGIVAAPIGPCQSGLDHAFAHGASVRAMSAPARDTIFALSSGRPPAAIAVVRMSGPRAGDALKALAGKLPEPRKAGLARVRDPHSGEVIDEALALWFPGPNSETGEDIAELQLHGGRAVIAAVLGALGRDRRIAAGGGGRVHAPRVRERPARPHRGRGSRRSDRRRDRGAAPSGATRSSRACSAIAPRPGGRG